MTDYINAIIKTNLFDNIDKKEIPNILENFKSQKKILRLRKYNNRYGR